ATPKEGHSSDTVAVADQALAESVDRPATAAAVAVAMEPAQAAFASFPAPTTPSGDPPAFDGEDDDFVWGEAAEAPTPEMPRHSPPRVPLTPPAAGGANGTDSAHNGVGDGAPPPPSDGGDGNGGGVDDGDGGGGGDGGDWSDDAFETFQSPPPPPDSDADGGVVAVSGDADDGDDGDWSDDPFDTFQSAPPAAPTPLASPPPAPQPTLLEPTRPAAAAAAERSPSSSPPPATETSSWNLDFLMGAPVKGGGGGGDGSEGRLSPLPGGTAGVSPVGGGGVQSGKPMDLVR
ncbi:unnamed protein product, partial [Ectocarpus sp. 8 AP-2014]